MCFPGAGIKTLPELLAAARAKPMSYASGGPGVPGHMAMEMLLADAGVQMQHVPYRGPSPAMQDVMGGMVPCGFLASPTVGPIIRDGKLVAIAVSGSKRLGSQPTVPTVAQAGIQGYDASFAEMMAMPLAAPELRERLATMDLEVVANTPEEAARRLRAEHQRWGQVAARVQLQLD
ncbi:Tripartite tricarboxylate transporter family receptor [compost metagenome]